MFDVFVIHSFIYLLIYLLFTWLFFSFGLVERFFSLVLKTMERDQHTPTKEHECFCGGLYCSEYTYLIPLAQVEDDEEDD